MIASAEEQRRRRDICATCPNAVRTARLSVHVCSLCGCPLASKTKFQRATCPAGKWQQQPTRSTT